MKLNSVTVKESVAFNSPADLTLVSAAGDLELDEALRCVIAKSHTRPLFLIPLENVRTMVPMTADLAAANDAKAGKPSLNGLVGLAPAEVAKREVETQKRRAEAKAGVVKFERGPDGKPVEKSV